MIVDVPSPIDLRNEADARAWTRTAMELRPFRRTFFDAFAAALRTLDVERPRVLELGAGPGFLADHLLRALPALSYVMLDFSAAMHALAAERLGPRVAQVQQVERSFKQAGFGADLGPFDAVVTMQAVHELRHKQYAHALHAEVRGLLAPGGRYLVCDHFVGDGGMKNDQLYMTIAEQRAALAGAGFSDVQEILCQGGLVLHRATT